MRCACRLLVKSVEKLLLQAVTGHTVSPIVSGHTVVRVVGQVNLLWLVIVGHAVAVVILVIGKLSGRGCHCHHRKKGLKWGRFLYEFQEFEISSSSLQFGQKLSTRAVR